MTGRRLRIAAVGDVMCGESFYQYGRGPRSMLDRQGAAFFDQDVGALLRSHDLAFANIECVLSDVGYKPSRLRSHHMRARGDVAPRLREWGINLANLANNHILEHGQDAAVDTARRLRAAGVAVVGAGAEEAFQPHFAAKKLTLGDTRVGVLAACLLDEPYAFSGGLREGDLAGAVRGLANSNDLVIVSLHWGSEYMARPRSAQKQTAHTLVDAGADIILGHHPHVMQGVECYRGALIAYSLGNFVFDQLLPDTRWSAILSIEWECDRLAKWEFHPVVLDHQHRPSFAHGLEAARLHAELERRSAMLAKAEQETAFYEVEARRQTAAMRRLLYGRIASSALTLPPAMTMQLILRPLLRRTGYW